mgnify:CR=1 FL=1
MLSNKQKCVLEIFKYKIEKEQFINNQSSIYYYKQNNKFTVPGIIITAIASATSFLTTTDDISDDMKKVGGLSVGILTVGSTLLQSISSSYGFKTRAEAFAHAADLYSSLLTKIEFEITNPKDDFDYLCNFLEYSILKIKSDNKYLPPLFIYKLWRDYKKNIHTEKNNTSIFGITVGDLKNNVKKIVKNETIEKVIELKENIEEIVEDSIEMNDTYQTIKKEHDNTINNRNELTNDIYEAYNNTMTNNSNDNIINIENI